MTLNVRQGLASRANVSTTSMRAVADSLKMHYPVSFRAIFDVLEPITLTPLLDAGTCSGSCTIVLSSDGHGRFSGHVHNSGALAARYTAITAINASLDETTNSAPILITRQGDAGGTLSIESRNDTWDSSLTDARIARQWGPIKAAAATATTQFGTDTGATELIEGLAGGAVGTFLFKL